MGNLYLQTVDTYRRGLKAMLQWLEKARAFAEAKKFDVNTLIDARLAPDMYPFAKQVELACHCAKGQSDLLCGRQPAPHGDADKTFAELTQRIEATLSYLATLKPEDLAGGEYRRIPIPTGPDKWISGGEFVDQIANPNFFFHASMAYAILRHNGVDLGKRDFLGEVNVRQGGGANRDQAQPHHRL